MLRTLALVIAFLALADCTHDTAIAQTGTVPVVSYPTARDPSCRGGHARIYDECGSQMAIFRNALAAAQSTGKVVIVNFGAEWCIWCHVIDSHLNGGAGRFHYPVDGQEVTLIERAAANAADQARALNSFAAQNFVIAHIEGDNAPDSWEVLEATGASRHFNESYPFVFTVTPDGRFATLFDYERVEIRREGSDWYRGYDRTALLAELTRMRDAARR